MKLINGYTEEQILENIQRETIASLWGESVKFKPYLLKKKFGDGEQLIYFSTYDDRPYYWYVLVDSKTDVDELDSEEIHQAIEEECGNYDNDYEPGSGGCGACSVCDLCKDDENRDYPVIAEYTSPHWGFVCNFRTGEYRYDDDMFNNK